MARPRTLIHSYRRARAVGARPGQSGLDRNNETVFSRGSREMFVRKEVGWLAGVLLIGCAALARGDAFELMTGLDMRLTPGPARTVVPIPGSPGIPGSFTDGDRLAGTSPAGAAANWQGNGTPFFAANQFGSLSFLFRRGSFIVPAPGNPVVPLLTVEYLGGPRLDLDGDLGNGSRSLVPVPNQTPVTLPGLSSFVDLSINSAAGSIQLNHIDATGSNEGSQNLSPGNGVTVNTLAGTSPSGSPGAAINPGVDTRTGTLTAFSGTGSLTGVYRIDSLGYELWHDSIDSASSTASTLGTFQYLGAFRGWLIERDPNNGLFPTLAGQGLGSTLWASVDVSRVGQIYNTTFPPVPTATIVDGVPGRDVYSAPGNGGLPLTAFGGDLGAYLDSVVLPLADPNTRRVVYLEAAGVGINNSPDPVFRETNGYDVVLIAQSPVPEPSMLALMTVGLVAVVRRRAGR